MQEQIMKLSMSKVFDKDEKRPLANFILSSDVCAYNYMDVSTKNYISITQ